MRRGKRFRWISAGEARFAGRMVRDATGTSRSEVERVKKRG